MLICWKIWIFRTSEFFYVNLGFSEDSYQQQAVIDGEPALLDILDTAGQVEFTAMRDQYMRCGEGFVICYSVTDRQSFREAAEYRRLIARVRPHEDIPLVLVANKRDLHTLRKVQNLKSWFEYISIFISEHVSGDIWRRKAVGCPTRLSVFWNIRCPASLHRWCLPCTHQRNKT